MEYLYIVVLVQDLSTSSSTGAVSGRVLEFGMGRGGGGVGWFGDRGVYILCIFKHLHIKIKMRSSSNLIKRHQSALCHLILHDITYCFPR